MVGAHMRDDQRANAGEVEVDVQPVRASRDGGRRLGALEKAAVDQQAAVGVHLQLMA